ncbi:L,D-transpeptidase [Notoacmeibacter sp. MSK16QG-6]|uniref:L,D-transpeptidase n=1 Tax=Notoacmeibacter sp. MSK16QG-6 TaxID=2957982 RepID=UPI00209FF035|nr:L,D-transpeptidase [Notoacmeibacter sp. MSK16QG-6]MCP1199932.1 L,D-transpeptidase [Notoacmeibacter sp. MSK16QG-6]
MKRLPVLTVAVGALVLSAANAPAVHAQIQADVVIGQNGERIFLDPRTGEVLTVQPPSAVRELPPEPRYEPLPRERDVRDIIRSERQAERQRQRDIRRAMRLERERTEERLRQRRATIQEQVPVIPDPQPAPLGTETLPEAVASTEEPGVATGTVGNPPAVAEPSVEAPKAAKPALGAGKMTVAKAQILLDRVGASPGVIDGVKGQNVLYAMDSWRKLTGELVDFTDESAIDEALEARGGAAFVDYTITSEDVSGPYVAAIPADYGEKAAMPGMRFTSAREAIAERFHMDEDFLKSLNPGVDFGRQGQVIRVANIGAAQSGSVSRIVADKGREQVIAYDSSGRLIASYPATIGSSDTPSPSGTVKVERIALNPNYTYDPVKNFKQGENDKILTIPPGPNGPVGSVWIALSKPSYGIHGTPEPSKIGKTSSHGCVRLTNWDAKELAKMVAPGTTVVFED